MKKIIAAIVIVLVAIGAFVIFGCGKDKIDSSGVGNTLAKKVGGTATVKLPVNTKLVNVSWKTDPKTNKSSLYYLYRPMRENEIAETYRYQEDSTWGVLESTIVIIETKDDTKAKKK